MYAMTSDRGTWLESEIMKDDELVRRFLLGELTEDEAESVEARLLREDELFDLCEAVEADLLEAAARGELAPAERDRVLNRLASSPQGRARLALARDLAAFGDGKLSPEPLPAPLPFRGPAALPMRPAVRWAIAAGLAAILLGGIGGGIWNFVQENGTVGQGKLATEISRPGAKDSPGGHQTISETDSAPVGPSSEQADSGVETPPPDQARVPHQTEPEPPAMPPLIVELSLLTLRSGEEPTQIEKVEIPSGKERIELHVDMTFAEDYDSYDAVVMSGKKEIFRGESLKPTSIGDRGPFLVFDLPASALPAGRYTVEVYGRSADGSQELEKSGEIEVTGGG